MTAEPTEVLYGYDGTRLVGAAVVVNELCDLWLMRVVVRDCGVVYGVRVVLKVTVLCVGQGTSEHSTLKALGRVARAAVRTSSALRELDGGMHSRAEHSGGMTVT